MRTIGELRNERIRLGVTQRAVAEAMGTTQSALSRAERDGNPTQTFLERYERALNARAGTHARAFHAESVPEIATLRVIAAEIAQRHGVQDLYVYGSVARGEAHADSDVDLLYRMAPGSPRTMTVIQTLRDDLECALGHRVSLTSYDSLIRDAETSRAGKRFLSHIRPDLIKVA